MNIIPAIDIMDGKCVRLSQGDFNSKTIYHEDPLLVARKFEDAGLRRLHLVDLDGARSGSMVNLSVLKKIAGQTNLEVDFGGGVKTEDDLSRVFDAGAAMVSIGSLAAKNPLLLEEWIDSYGADKFMVGADMLDGSVRISGWQEDSKLGVIEFIYTMVGIGVVNIFCTDISTDGMLGGPSIHVYSAILERFPNIKLIASGGVGSIEDVYRLKAMGCAGVIIGKAIYEDKFTLGELKAVNED